MILLSSNLISIFPLSNNPYSWTLVYYILAQELKCCIWRIRSNIFSLIQYLLPSWEKVPNHSAKQVEPHRDLENIVPWTWEIVGVKNQFVVSNNKQRKSSEHNKTMTTRIAGGRQVKGRS